MNSTDKRIEELLNRAGQTISDLPKDYQDAAECMRAYAEVQKWRSENNLSTQHECEKYILHLTDVIDRFEWALENVCGERDYLRTMARKEGCRTCIHHTYDNHLLCENEGKLCSLDDRGNCENYEYEGVPEGWSVDDENR